MAVQIRRSTRPPLKTYPWLFRMGLAVAVKVAAWPSQSEVAPESVGRWGYRPVTLAPPSSSGAWVATWPLPSACQKTPWTFQKTAAVYSCACTAAHATSSSKSTPWAIRASSHTFKAPTQSWALCGLLTRSTQWSEPLPSVERLCRWRMCTFSLVSLTCSPPETPSSPWLHMVLWRIWRHCHPVNWSRTHRGPLAFTTEECLRLSLLLQPAAHCSHSSFCCFCKKKNHINEYEWHGRRWIMEALQAWGICGFCELSVVIWRISHSEKIAFLPPFSLLWTHHLNANMNA